MTSKLILGDCLKVMQDIPDNSIDLVLTDPPYGTTACKWDSVIPFEPMWKQLKRITKDNGAICLFGSEPFSSALRMSNLKMFKYNWYWNKNKGANFATVKYKPFSVIETISIFSYKAHNYFPLMEKMEKARKIKVSNRGNETMGGLVRIEGTYTEKHPHNYLSFNSPPNSKGKLHPTQKPVPLLEYLIKTYTLEDETVLDFTMGSGSTGVACKNLNRSFIGIENDENYFKIAESRIDKRQGCQ